MDTKKKVLFIDRDGTLNRLLIISSIRWKN